MSGRVALITGGNSGIGRAAASQLLARGWEVVIATRRPAAGAAAVEALARGAGDGGGAVSWVELDLARLESVRTCAQEVGERWPRLDALINNAGTVRSTRELSVDGFELSFQTNHLGHFLLTHVLREALRAAVALNGEARVVNVTSKMHTRSKGIDFDDLTMERGYGPLRAYADTKLANVYFTRELARRWPEVRAYAVHPGGVRTELGRWGRAARSDGLGLVAGESLHAVGGRRREADRAAGGGCGRGGGERRVLRSVRAAQADAGRGGRCGGAAAVGGECGIRGALGEGAGDPLISIPAWTACGS